MSGDLVPMHDGETCPICGPIVRSEAYQRGREAALATIPRTVIEIQEVATNEP